MMIFLPIVATILFSVLTIVHSTDSSMPEVAQYGTQWVTKRSVHEMHKAKACLHARYESLIHGLFKNLTNQTHVSCMEARALDHFARLLRLGGSFCDTYILLVPWVEQRVEFEVPPHHRHRHGHGHGHRLEQNRTLLRERCEAIDATISMSDPLKHRGAQLSPLIQCLNKHRRNAAKKYIAHQFSGLEEDAKKFVKR